MIFDCFTFCGEFDMLECRLTELDESVDYFVLVEAPETFTGKPKPLHYAENRERYARWADKILNLTATLPPGDPWTKEAAQREALSAAGAVLAWEPEDTIVLSDVDEIWHPGLAIDRLPEPYTVLALKMYVHHLGWQHPIPWDGPVVTKVRNLPPAEIGTFQTLRSVRLHPRPHRVHSAGWHLSWFGGSDAAERKQRAFSHTEYADVDMLAASVDGLHIDGTPLVRVEHTVDVPRFAHKIPGWWP